MHKRVLMAQFNPDWVVIPGTGTCGCGQEFQEKEVVLLYPQPDSDDGLRDVVCMTCHFWTVHEVLEEMGR